MNGEKTVLLLLSQGTPTAGTISRRSQVLQFDEIEESDCDIQMIGEDSEDVVNSLIGCIVTTKLTFLTKHLEMLVMSNLLMST